MTARVTIIDLARELGISKSAVANVLSGTGRYSDETADRVHAAAERLGYVTNRAARSLRSGRSGAYGLHLPAVAHRLPFYTEFAFGAAEGADDVHADLTLFTSRIDPDRHFAVDGAIVVDPEPDEPVVAALIRARVPVVSVGAYHGAGETSVAATLDARHDQLQREVLDRLYERGRRRPILLTVTSELSSAWAVETERTFRTWSADAAVDAVITDVGANAGRPGGDRAVGAALAAISDHRADAVVCVAQGTAQVVRVALEARGIRIGSQLDLASFAASPDELRDRDLTVVDLEPGEYGRTAARILSTLLGDPSAETGAHHWFEAAHVRFAE